MSAAEVTQLASTIFAAIAAVGSGVAAFVMYRQWLAGTTPALTVDIAQYQPRGIIQMTLVNYGAAVKKVSIAVIEGNQACLAFLPPHGFMSPGERSRLTLGLDPSGKDEMVAVAYGFDVRGDWVYAWAANGQSGRWRARSGRFRRRPTDLSVVSILQRFYPHAPDPMALEKRAVVQHAPG